MVNQPHIDSSFLPPSSTSTILSGMPNTFYNSSTLVADKEIQGMTGTFNSVFSLPFQCGMHSSPSVISIMPASTCHPQASFMRTCTSQEPKFTKFTAFTKCSFALFSPFHQLPSFHHGLQAIAVTITPIKGY